jgi:hypothetical protein
MVIVREKNKKYYLSHSKIDEKEKEKQKENKRD